MSARQKGTGLRLLVAKLEQGRKVHLPTTIFHTPMANRQPGFSSTVVHDKLSAFLQTWLHKSQSGFKKGDGTVPQLLRLCQEWSRHIDNSANVGVLFFDLRKAFDPVWHDGLMSKLEAAGIRGSAFAWMKSFLTSHRQITTVEGCTSPPAEIGAGVPQSAILSPLLFSVYVNDLSSATPARNINLFADDTSAYVTSQGPSL